MFPPLKIFWCRKKFLLLTLGPKKVRKDFAEKEMAWLRTIKLGPRILKIVVFEARRSLLHSHFGLGSNANVFYFFICCVTSEPEMRVKESSASFKNNNF